MKKVILQFFVIILFVILFIMILLGFFIVRSNPNINSIKDTVYLEYQDRASGYSIEANEGELISWEFRTYNNPFIVYFKFQEWRIVISWKYSSDKGIIEVPESGVYHFYFDNIGQNPPQDGYLEFEVNVIVRIPGYHPSIILAIFIFISFLSIIFIEKKKKLSVNLNSKGSPKEGTRIEPNTRN